MAKRTAILAVLSLASLLLGRAAPSLLWDLFAVGCALLAFCSWRGRARPSAIENLSLGIGLLLFVTTGPLLVFSAIAHVGPFEARKEDTFEPNDTFATATRLKAGAEIIASVFPNNPDVFSLDAPAGATIVFKLRSLGHEDCAYFEVTGPRDKTLYRDEYGQCERHTAVQAAGISISGHYELHIRAQDAGTYFLTIRESQRADNVFLFAWEYGLTGLVE